MTAFEAQLVRARARTEVGGCSATYSSELQPLLTVQTVDIRGVGSRLVVVQVLELESKLAMHFARVG